MADDAKTLIYLSTNYHRIYDRCKNRFDHNEVTVTHNISRFSSHNHCLDFTNTNHSGLRLINANTNNSLDISNESFTICAWLKAYPDNSDTGYLCFIGNGEESDVEIWADKNSELESINDASTSTVTDSNVISGSLLSDEDWHYITLTRIKGQDASGASSTEKDVILTFIDGKKTSTAEIDSTKKFNSTNFTIGASAKTNQFIGYMDDFVFIKNKNLWTDTFTPPTDYLSDLPVDTIRTNAFKQLGTNWSGDTSVITSTKYNELDITDLLELEKSFQLAVV